MRKIVTCIFLILLYSLLPADEYVGGNTNDDISDWAQALHGAMENDKRGARPKILTYDNLIGTYWVLKEPFREPFLLTKCSGLLTSYTTGYIFLPDNLVLIVEEQWSAFRLDESIIDTSDFSSQIISFKECTVYKIENGKLMLPFDHIEITLKDS